MFLGHRSAWTYNTSGGAGASWGAYSGETGQIVLNDPTGQQVTFTYVGMGIGPGIGVKLPGRLTGLIGKIIAREMSGGASTFAMPSSGDVFVTRWCNTDELTADDFRGGCCFGEINIGVGIDSNLQLARTHSRTIFLLGMDITALAKLALHANPSFHDVIGLMPKALISAQGTGFGLGIGAALYSARVV